MGSWHKDQFKDLRVFAKFHFITFIYWGLLIYQPWIDQISIMSEKKQETPNWQKLRWNSNLASYDLLSSYKWNTCIVWQAWLPLLVRIAEMAWSVLPVSPQEATRLKRQAQESAVRDWPVLSFIPVLRTVISKRSWKRDSVDKIKLNYIHSTYRTFHASVYLFIPCLIIKKNSRHLEHLLCISSFPVTLFPKKLEYLYKKDLREHLVQPLIFVNKKNGIYPRLFKRNLSWGIHTFKKYPLK